MRLKLTASQMEKARDYVLSNASFETSRKIARSGKALPEMTQAMSIVPGIMELMDVFGKKLYPGGMLDRVLAEKLIIKVSELNSCQFCAGIHTDELLKGLGGKPGTETTPADDRERAALEYAEQVTRDSNRVTDELFERLRGHFSQEQLAELTFFISFMNCLNRFNNALQIVYAGDFPEK